jgi:putative FmdB family regulatory protein
MPIYEYTCQDCGHTFENFVRSVTNTVEPSCPKCGGSRAKKGWSLFGTSKADATSAGLASAASCSPAGT